MIIRKPYAFLIKYFKVIHIAFFLIMTYLLFKIRNIYVFFKEFLITGTYIHKENLVFEYVSIPMILLTISLIVVLVLIYLLMRQKKKPVFYYLSAFIFYSLIFLTFLILVSFFNKLEFQSYSNQTLVIYRDLTMVFYYLNFYFLGVSFARGFGFNIKKFNFEKDIKELDIEESDREEIEIGSKIDYDNIFNFLRRNLREWRYYFKENSFIFIIFLVIVILGISGYIAVDKLVFNKMYKEGEVITLNDISYTVNNSYVTNKDYYLEYIKNEDTYYLIIDFSVYNKGDNNINLKIDNYRVKIGNKYYYPKTNIRSKFSDLGVMYSNQIISVNSNKRYIIVFEIGNIKNKKMVFELYYGKKTLENDAILYYKEIRLEPNTFKEKELGSYQLTEKVNLKDTFLEIDDFTINNYEVLDSYNYKYTKCDNESDEGTCRDYEASVTPKVGKKILKIEYTKNLENEKVFKYLNIKYQSNGRENTLKANSLENITPSNCQDNIYLVEIPSDIDITGGKLVFLARNVSFEYVL